MKLFGRDWHLKSLGKYPPITLGIDLSVCERANRIGLRVPRTIAISGDAIGSEIISDTKPLQGTLDELNLLELAKLVVFDYCVGCVNVFDGPALLRDADDYPCYSERHDKNVLFDGKGIWYIDYGHVFGRTLMLFSQNLSVASSLENTIPESGIREDFASNIKSALRWFRDDAIKFIKSRECMGLFEFEPNVWLDARMAQRMSRIYLQRMDHL